MTAPRFELPEQARKIRDRERQEIERRAADALPRARTPTAALTEACSLLTVRQRYMGAVGEHFSVQDLEGIIVVDALDEDLLRAVRQLLKAFIDRHKKIPPPKALALLVERLPVNLRDLPQYPTAYVILYVIRSAAEGFEKILEGDREFSEAELEHALAHFILGLADKFVQTRERPVQRHFSDVEREYSAVARLKCSCGEEKYKVTLQSLHVPDDGLPYDQLDLQCGSCGRRRTITFDLPHFKDMYQL